MGWMTQSWLEAYKAIEDAGKIMGKDIGGNVGIGTTSPASSKLRSKWEY